MCQNLVELIQRAGRAIRNPGAHGLFLLMYKPWILDIKLEKLDLNPNDPDQPHTSPSDK